VSRLQGSRWKTHSVHAWRCTLSFNTL
jgi:hypothetical protein